MAEDRTVTVAPNYERNLVNLEYVFAMNEVTAAPGAPKLKI
jgi:hypothetical protein